MVAFIIKLIVAILLGTGAGTIISLAIWSKFLAKSNVLGDSAGGFNEYSDSPIDIIWRRNGVDSDSKNTYFKRFKEEYLIPNGMKPGDYSYLDDEFPDYEDLPEVDIPLFKPKNDAT
ncbi:MAG: hypothetical protein IK142_03775 [Clostridiales bacterium]|nr:hypothetical protein [Clostridiales bacterium]